MGVRSGCARVSGVLLTLLDRPREDVYFGAIGVDLLYQAIVLREPGKVCNMFHVPKWAVKQYELGLMGSIKPVEIAL